MATKGRVGGMALLALALGVAQQASAQTNSAETATGKPGIRGFPAISRG